MSYERQGGYDVLTAQPTEESEVKTRLKVESYGPVGGESPDPDIWAGEASAKNYDFGRLSKEFYLSRIPEYYHEVTPGAEIRCVEKRQSGVVGLLYDFVRGIEPSDDLLNQVLESEDSRFSSKTLRGEAGRQELERLAGLIRQGEVVQDDPVFMDIRAEVSSEPLGPQTVGGSQALAHAYAIAKDVPKGLTLSDVIKEVGQFPDDFKGCNHRDEHAKPPKIGCKAMDSDETILYIAGSALHNHEVEGIAHFILGYTPDKNVEHKVLANIAKINHPEVRSVYFMHEDGVATHREEGLKTLEEVHGSEVEIVAGGAENAVFFSVNRQPGVSFHKNLFALDMMGMGVPNPPGIYSMDFERSKERANTLFPNDELRQRMFLKARCRYNAGTLMVLCDGSLELIEISAEE